MNTRIRGILWYSCLENPMDRGAWWAAIHGVTKSDMTYWLNNNNRETKAPEVTHLHPWYTFPFFFISFFVSLSSLHFFDFFFLRLNISIKDLYDLLLSPQAFQNQLKCFGKNLRKPGYGPSCSLATHKGETLLSSVKCSYCNFGKRNNCCCSYRTSCLYAIRSLWCLAYKTPLNLLDQDPFSFTK